MKLVNWIVRIICGLVAAFLILYGVRGTRFYPFLLMGIPLAAFLIAGGLAVFAVLGDGPKVRRYLLAALLDGSVVGVLGCVIGGIGAGLIYRTNLAPIVGPLFFGPVGFGMGALIGVLRQRKREPLSP